MASLSYLQQRIKYSYLISPLLVDYSGMIKLTMGKTFSITSQQWLLLTSGPPRAWEKILGLLTGPL